MRSTYLAFGAALFALALLGFALPLLVGGPPEGKGALEEAQELEREAEGAGEGEETQAVELGYFQDPEADEAITAAIKAGKAEAVRAGAARREKARGDRRARKGMPPPRGPPSPPPPPLPRKKGQKMTMEEAVWERLNQANDPNRVIIPKGGPDEKMTWANNGRLASSWGAGLGREQAALQMKRLRRTGGGEGKSRDTARRRM